MKKVLLYCYNNQNLGDDLFIKIIKDHFPEYEFKCFVQEHTDVEWIENHLQMKCSKYKTVCRRADKLLYRLFKKAFFLPRILKEYDEFIILGGSMFIEGEKWVNALELLSIISEYIKKKYVIGANFGPFRTQGYLEGYKRLFGGYTKLIFRDTASGSLFSDVRAESAPDFVFNLDCTHYLPEKKKKRVGLSVIDPETKKIKNPESYYRFIVKAASFFFEKGYEIALFSFCEPEGDLRACMHVQKKLDGLDSTIIPYKGDIGAMLSELALCEYIVASRFHSMILGWKMDVKTLPVIYSEKFSNVIADTGQDVFYIRMEKPGDISFDNFEDCFMIPDNIRFLTEKADVYFDGI